MAAAAGEEPGEAPGERAVNVNIGILGHVDSGKTSLVAALSTVLSTAALDKSPQSKSRGITLDLGLSAFTIDMPARLAPDAAAAGHPPGTPLRFTLVDCPGHASLIRTVIGGASIIDMAILVVDIVKGFQTQTSECLVLAEICCRDLIVVLNKVDLIAAADRDSTIRLATQRVAKTLSRTRFAGAPVVATAAAPSGERAAGSDGLGVGELVRTLGACTRLPARDASRPFLYAIDHCFSIRGRGTVLAGTVLSGSIRTQEELEVVHLRERGRVRSLEVFRRSVPRAVQGDRVAVCVPTLDAKRIERGLAAAPRSVPTITSAVLLLRKVRWHAGDLLSGKKLHVTLGHTTAMATLYYFGAAAIAAGEQSAPHESDEPDGASGAGLSAAAAPDVPPGGAFDWAETFEWMPRALDAEAVLAEAQAAFEARNVATPGRVAAALGLDRARAEEDAAEGDADRWAPRAGGAPRPLHFAFCAFAAPVHCPMDSLAIASRLEEDRKTAGGCRIAAYGRILRGSSGDRPPVPSLYKWKMRTGAVSRATSAAEFLLSGMFVSAAALSSFLGCRVLTERGVRGVLVAPFGTGGDARVKVDGLAEGFSAAPGPGVREGDAVFLRFKKFVKVEGVLPAAAQPGAGAGASQGKAAAAHSSVFQDTDCDVLPRELHAPPEEAPPPREAAPAKPKPAPPAPEPEAEAEPEPPARTVRSGTICSFKKGASEDGAVVAIVAGAFEASDDIRALGACSVELVGRDEASATGVLQGPFAKAGKCKVRFPEDAGARIGDTVEIVLGEQHA